MIAIQRSKSLREQVYQAIRKIILAGELASGERIVETKLAEQLQVSRTPIREAIGQLQREHLVVSNPNGGFKVATLSVEDTKQLYDCRIALEQLAVASSCEKIEPQQLQQLEAYAIAAETIAASKSAKPDIYELLELDYQFHRLIAETSGNRWLLDLLNRIFDKMALLRIQTTRQNPEVLEIRIEHRQIYEAIASKSPDIARQTIREHLIASKNRVVREMEIINAKGKQ